MAVPFGISRSIVKSKGMDVRFHTRLIIDDSISKSYKPYHIIFTMNKKDYMVLDVSSYVSLKYIPSNNADKTGLKDSLLISDKYIYYILKGLRDMKRIMYNKDTYYLVDGKLKVNNLETNTIRLGLGKENSIMMFPDIKESDGIEYEIVALCVNSPDRLIELDLESFEALLYALSKVDYFMYSQALLNYFISSVDKDKYFKDNMPKYDMMRYDNISAINQTDSIKEVELGDKGLPTKNQKRGIFEEAGLYNENNN
jgi:hypothetical protein